MLTGRNLLWVSTLLAIPLDRTITSVAHNRARAVFRHFRHTLPSGRTPHVRPRSVPSKWVSRMPFAQSATAGNGGTTLDALVVEAFNDLPKKYGKRQSVKNPLLD
jgi:hypothetical protein